MGRRYVRHVFDRKSENCLLLCCISIVRTLVNVWLGHGLCSRHDFTFDKWFIIMYCNRINVIFNKIMNVNQMNGYDMSVLTILLTIKAYRKDSHSLSAANLWRRSVHVFFPIRIHSKGEERFSSSVCFCHELFEEQCFEYDKFTWHFFCDVWAKCLCIDLLVALVWIMNSRIF